MRSKDVDDSGSITCDELLQFIDDTPSSGSRGQPAPEARSPAGRELSPVREPSPRAVAAAPSGAMMSERVGRLSPTSSHGSFSVDVSVARSSALLYERGVVFVEGTASRLSDRLETMSRDGLSPVQSPEYLSDRATAHDRTGIESTLSRIRAQRKQREQSALTPR